MELYEIAERPVCEISTAPFVSAVRSSVDCTRVSGDNRDNGRCDTAPKNNRDAGLKDNLNSRGAPRNKARQHARFSRISRLSKSAFARQLSG
jgi:hypothetical protein